jgi:PAS domain S-box-containing protein
MNTTIHCIFSTIPDFAYMAMRTLSADFSEPAGQRIANLFVPFISDEYAFLKLLLLLLLSSLLFVVLYSFQLHTRLRQEILKRHRATQALQTQLDNNKALLLAAGDGIHVLDLQGNLVLANEAFCRLLGYHCSELKQLNVADWDVQWSKEELIANIPTLRGLVSTFETKHRRRDGKVIAVEVNTVGVDIDQQPLLFCSARDITLRKQQENQLLQAASVFHHSHESIALMDQHGRMVDANQAFSRVTGYSLHEVLGKCPPLMNSEQKNPALCDQIKQQLQQTGVWYGETQNLRKNGERYTTKLTISQVPGTELGETSYVGIFTDITPLKEYQRHLESMVNYDALTGLPNRLLLLDRLQQASQLAARATTQLLVLYIDLDGFKLINDRYGHDVGDLFLRHIASAMRQVLRDGDTAELLLRKADMAMYHAKRAGKNQWQWSADEQNDLMLTQ